MTWSDFGWFACGWVACSIASYLTAVWRVRHPRARAK